MIQDAPVSGTFLSASISFYMAKELENVAYFKNVPPQLINNLCKFIALRGFLLEVRGREGLLYRQT